MGDKIFRTHHCGNAESYNNCIVICRFTLPTMSCVAPFIQKDVSTSLKLADQLILNKLS